MRTHTGSYLVHTTGAPDLVDITTQVQTGLTDSGIGDGHIVVFSPDGCRVVVNELESGLMADLKRAMRRLAGWTRGGRRPPIGSTSVVLPAASGKLHLGVWQRVLLLELEKSGIRAVTVQVIGE